MVLSEQTFAGSRGRCLNTMHFTPKLYFIHETFSIPKYGNLRHPRPCFSAIKNKKYMYD